MTVLLAFDPGRGTLAVVVGLACVVLLAVRWWWRWVHGKDDNPRRSRDVAAAPVWLPFRRARPLKFKTNEELFQAVLDLIATLERQGHRAAASEIRGGFGALNGLTDGWAALMESMDEVHASAGSFTPDVRERLDGLRATVRRIMYRR